MSIEDFQKAAKNKDIELAMSALADDVVLHSPLTDRFTFNGKEDDPPHCSRPRTRSSTASSTTR